MIAMSIAERRNITPAVKLNERLQSSKRSTRGKSGEKSSKYFMDMNSRRLPPPLVFYSDSEKDAWIKNKNEQARLDKVLDHLNIQEHVYGQIFTKESSVVRTRSQRFQDRVKARVTGPGDKGEEEDKGGGGDFSLESSATTRSRARLGSTCSGSTGTQEYVSYQIETKHGTIRKTIAKPSAIAWADNGDTDNRGGYTGYKTLHNYVTFYYKSALPILYTCLYTVYFAKYISYTPFMLHPLYFRDTGDVGR